MKLLVSNERAVDLLQTIPHSTCRSGMFRHWRVSPAGDVRAQSALWLFCWAKTGMNSQEAAGAAREIFNRLLPVSFAQFDARVSHSHARQKRYATGNIDAELANMLGDIAD